MAGFTKEAQDLLRAYSWPGNIRELKNLVERVVVLARGPRIGVEMLPPEISGRMPSAVAADGGGSGALDGGPMKTLDDVERMHIEAVLRAENNNRSSTSRILGISRSTLIEKLKKYGII